MGLLDLVLLVAMVVCAALLVRGRGAATRNGTHHNGNGHGNGHGKSNGNGHGNGHGAEDADEGSRLFSRTLASTGRYYWTTTRQAGLNPDTFRPTYWSIKILLPLALIVVAATFWPGSGSPGTLLLLLLAVIGFFFVDAWILLLRRRRRARVKASLSYFVDLVVALLHAGLNPGEAFLRAARGGFRSSHPLAKEVALIGREIESGQDPAAGLKMLANRTGVSEIAVLAATVGMGARLGVPVVVSLEAQADLLRAKRREDGLTRINVAGVRSVFPVILCGIPLLLVLVFFPAYVQFQAALQQTRSLVREIVP